MTSILLVKMCRTLNVFKRITIQKHRKKQVNGKISIDICYIKTVFF